MKKREFLGLDSVEIRVGRIDLIVSKSVGPRILSLSINGGNNIFAELPNLFLEYPGEENFCFYGGHLLWCGPEDPFIPYKPDSQPIHIRKTNQSIELIQKIDPISGVQKTIKIRPTNYDTILTIDHYIQNVKGKHSFQCAPWAITQLKLGGEAIIPQQLHEVEPNSLLPDRSIILWPYSDINDSRINWNNQFINIHAQPIEKALKIGITNYQKWMAYFYDNLLFIKYANNYASTQLIDFGATSQFYINSKFVELETLAPLADIKPGERIRHREVWRVVENPFNYSPDTVKDFFDNDQMTDICRELLLQ